MTMTNRSPNRWAYVVMGTLLFPALGSAQESPPPAQGATELVFEREMFTYPSVTRRNPFRPLVSGDSGGPVFESLTLMGIVYSEDPSLSLATLSTYTLSVAQDGTVSTAGEGESYYMKVGQTIGNITVVEVNRDNVVVEVEEFGLTDRKTMFLLNRRQGGTQ
jgi:hypothetical protein